MTTRLERFAWLAVVAGLLVLAISDVPAQGLKPGGSPSGGGQVTLDTSRLRTQVDTLERANAELDKKLRDLESRVNGLRSQEAARAAAKAMDWQQFRADVRKVMDAEIQQLAALDTAYARHTHDYTAPRGGWANLDTLQNCPTCLINFESSPDSRPSTRPQTGKPN